MSGCQLLYKSLKRSDNTNFNWQDSGITLVGDGTTNLERLTNRCLGKLLEFGHSAGVDRKPSSISRIGLAEDENNIQSVCVDRLAKAGYQTFASSTCCDRRPS